MPPGTPPRKVLTAVRKCAREEFYGQYCYALVLHTDEPHPHVHLVLKAVSEQGVRLKIKKATLRQWRPQFARRLLELGVAANATERAVRGETQKSQKDQIFHSSLRGDSKCMRSLAQAVSAEHVTGSLRTDCARKSLVDTRMQVVRGWQTVASQLSVQGERLLSKEFTAFLQQLKSVQSEPPRLPRRLLIESHAASA